MKVLFQYNFKKCAGREGLNYFILEDKLEHDP